MVSFSGGLHWILLEVLINVQSAINQTNYQWLMFYPSLYMFPFGTLIGMQEVGDHDIPFFPLSAVLIS
jgi:hypothetical protein